MFTLLSVSVVPADSTASSVELGCDVFGFCFALLSSGLSSVSSGRGRFLVFATSAASSTVDAGAVASAALGATCGKEESVALAVGVACGALALA